MAHPYLYGMNNDENYLPLDSDEEAYWDDMNESNLGNEAFFNSSPDISEEELTDSDASGLGEETLWLPEELAAEQLAAESSSDSLEYESLQSEEGDAEDDEEGTPEEPEAHIINQNVPEKALKYCRGQLIDWNVVLRQPEENTPVPPDSMGVVKRVMRGLPIHACHVCGKRYCYESKMLQHTVEQHYLVAEELECDKCGKVYFDINKLQHHVSNAECERTWNTVPDRATVAPLRPTLKPGPTTSFRGQSPTLVFLHYFMPLLRIWLVHTNRKGPLLFPEEQQKQNKAGMWTPVTVVEGLQWIKLYLGCGFMKYRSSRDPWRKSKLFSNVMFTTTMSGNRFNQIRKASCFATSALEQLPGGRGDINSEETYDRLWRVRDILDAFIDVSQATMNPSRELCIDEMMIAFKGRFGHVQTIPSKPIRKGIKFFIMSDPITGYVFNAIPYVSQTYPLAQKLGKIASFVIALLRGTNAPGRAKNFLNNGHYVITDNYYTSFRLMEWLLKNKTYYLGTIIPKRKVPLEMQTADRLVGDMVVPFRRGQYKMVKSNTGIQLTTWLDNKRVIIASTTPTITRQVGKCRRKIMRRGKNKRFIGIFGIRRPSVCKYYQKWMGGVDICNQLISYHHFQFKSRRWFMPIFYQLIDMCVLNAFTMWKKYNKKITINAKNKYSTRDFRRLLIEGLDKELEDSEDEGRRIDDKQVEYFTPKKWGLLGTAEQAQIKAESRKRKKFHRIAKLNNRGTCAACKKRCFEGCIACGVALHTMPCFKRFHPVALDG